jgi:hypothetical protein
VIFRLKKTNGSRIKWLMVQKIRGDKNWDTSYKPRDPGRLKGAHASSSLVLCLFVHRVTIKAQLGIPSSMGLKNWPLAPPDLSYYLV